MGIYRSRFIESAANTDDIGVDLTQVEKDIMGPDGIESHRDEADAAKEGLIGDPVDEAYYIMYEAEYNYNQIMKALGVAELNEAGMGREMIYEAKTVKDFFEKAKEVFVKMFKSLTEAVKKVLAAMDVQTKLDKKFVAKYEKDIREGAKKVTKEIPGYPFYKREEELSKTVEDSSTGFSTNTLAGIKLTLTQLRSGEFSKEEVNNAISNIEKAKEAVLSLFGGATTTEEAIAFSKATLGIKEKVDDVRKYISVDEIITVLKSEKETAIVKRIYLQQKKEFTKIISDIQKMSKDITPANYGDNTTTAMRVCEKQISNMKFLRSLSVTMYHVSMAAARGKRKQCRRLAHIYCKANGTKVETGGSEPGVQHNSAILSGVSFI